MSVQVTPQQLADMLAALGQTPAPVQRRAVSGAELLKIVAAAIEKVEATGKPFTRYSVTKAARELNPDVELDHEAIKPIVVQALKSAGYFTQVGRIGDEEAVVYTKVA